jgi:mRNA interferase YafQ
LKYEVVPTSKFKKELKKMKMRGCDITLLKKVVNKLANGEDLPIKNNAHRLSGSYSDYYECHIKPDWLLIYQFIEDKLILSLARTGTHSDLFK